MSDLPRWFVKRYAKYGIKGFRRIRSAEGFWVDPKRAALLRPPPAPSTGNPTTEGKTDE